jgi:hypothetical protein
MSARAKSPAAATRPERQRGASRETGPSEASGPDCVARRRDKKEAAPRYATPP